MVQNRIKSCFIGKVVLMIPSVHTWNFPYHHALTKTPERHAPFNQTATCFLNIAYWLAGHDHEQRNPMEMRELYLYREHTISISTDTNVLCQAKNGLPSILKMTGKPWKTDSPQVETNRPR
ncbi:hypothetical protein DESC_100040 [Desulfosarcina cetonica]|nr:hypothetical protein DESC_100040 [Desulfosarcina cetonica]